MSQNRQPQISRNAAQPSAAQRGAAQPGGPHSNVISHDTSRGLARVQDLFPDEPLGPITVVAAQIEEGVQILPHWHDKAQLVFALNGVMSVSTDEGFWIVPPNRAVWIPALKEHSFQIGTSLEMRTLYIDIALAPPQLDHCCVLQSSDLLRELVLRLLELPVAYDGDSRQTRLVGVILDEIVAAQTAPLHVPRPKHPKLRAIAEYIAEHPDDNRTLADWGSRLGASERTLARLFRQDTNMSFAQWRQQIRLLLALQMLAEAKPVTQVAIELGYESPSAFISMFRKSLGTTPSRYFS